MMMMTMLMVRAVFMLFCFSMINAQPTTDFDEAVDSDQCVRKNQDFIQVVMSPQQNQIQQAISVLEDTSRQVVNASQTLQRELAEVKESHDRSSEMMETTQELLKQMKETVDSISAQMTTATSQQSPPPSACGDPRQQLVSALTERCVPLLIQQNVNGSNFFNRSWEEFKAGFNDTKGNYWLGNELLHQLTVTGLYKLRFDLQSRRNTSNWYGADYSTFIISGETSKYRLHVAGYSGNAGSDAFGGHNGYMFTTYDRDNDSWTNSQYNDNCAVYNGGGFWYKSRGPSQCSYCEVNGIHGRGDDFSWDGMTGGDSLESSRMWLQCL